MIKLLLLAAGWLVSLKIYSFGGKISLTLLQSAWPLRLVNVFLKLHRVLHRPLTLFFRGLVVERALPPKGRGEENANKFQKRRKKKTSKENLGTCLVTPHPAPSKAQKQ